MPAPFTKATDPVNVRALLQEAGEHETRGRPAEAMAVYQKAVAREPSNIEALVGLGRLQLEHGQFEASAKALRRVVTLQPGLMIGQALLGMALARTGPLPEALACFERATAAGNAPPPVFLHMADALGALGRHADALAAFDRLLAADAANFIAWNNRGLTLEALGRDTEAAESFRRALALRPGTPESHFSLGNVLHRLGSHEAAVEQYRHTLAAWPAFARAHGHLGNALFKLKRWDEALASLGQATQLKSDATPAETAQLYATIAATLRQLQRDDEALANFDKALALDPDNADIMAKKAYALQVLGRIDEARSLLAQAIARQPDRVLPYMILAPMKRFEAGDPMIAQMEALLSRLDPQSEKERADLHFAIGKSQDDIGDFDRAFPNFAAGNEFKRRHIEYDEAREFAGKARIAEIFTPALLQSKAAQGDMSNRPIFVVGMPRSGTTLIEQIIASHPLVFGAGEQTAFEDSVTAAVRPGQPGYPRMVPPMTAAELKSLGAGYLARMDKIVPDGSRFTDKLPGNYNFAGLIHLALPNAKIVHVRRNALDTCLSIFSINFEEPPQYGYELGELGRYYRAYEQLLAHWRQVVPAGVMLEVEYEDVVNDIEAQARNLLSFCDLPWDDACLAFHDKNGAVRTASAYQVRQPLYRRSMERWRGYEKHLEPLRSALGR